MTCNWKIALLWRFCVDGNNNIYLRFHLKCPLILLDINKIWIFYTDFHKNPHYQISRKSIQWEPRGYMQEDRQTDMKVTGAFRECERA